MIGVSFLIISLSVAYYFVIFLPGKERLQLQIKQQEVENSIKKDQETEKNKIENKVNLDLCLKRAGENFDNNWNSGCEKQGLKKECELPTSWADTYTESLNNAKEDCFKRYPQ